jgi:hypothetical protein
VIPYQSSHRTTAAGWAAASLALILCAALTASCGRDKPAKQGVASRLPPAQRGEQLTLAILGPTSEANLTTTKDTVDIAGIAFGSPTEIRWQSPGGEGVAQGTEEWTALDIPVLEGDNTIVITAVAPEGNATAELHVKRNAFLDVKGTPSLSPAAAFVGEATEVLASIGIDRAAGVDPATLRLVQADGNGGHAHVVTLVDDGRTAESGDEIPGDGVYSGRFLITKSQESTLSLSVSADKMGGGKAAEVAALGEIEFVSHLSQNDYDKAASVVAEMEHAYQQAKEQGEEAAYGKALAVAAQDPAVLSYGISPGGSGVWVHMQGDVLGGTLFGAADERGGTEVGNHAAFTAGVFNDEFAPQDEAVDIDRALRDSSCPSYDLEGDGALLGENVTIDKLRGLTRHGLIFITTHGTTFHDPRGEAARRIWGSSRMDSHEVLITREKVTPEARAKYELELKTGQMVIGPTIGGSQRFFITSRFIDRLPGRFPRSLVYMGACRAYYNGEMAAAFLRKGAAAYLGFSDMVKNSFAYDTGKSFFQCMLTERASDGTAKTTGDCFRPGLNDGPLRVAGERGLVLVPRPLPGGGKPTPPPEVEPVERGAAYFKMLGAKDLTIAGLTSLRNGSFEEAQAQSGAGFQPDAWLRKGDARVMSSLGGYQPTGGGHTALISTGLGFTQANGEISQSFCVPAGTTKLSYDWNFISAEFRSYCANPKYQDNLLVTITERGGATQMVQAVKIDDLCASVADSSFAVPDVGYKDNDMKSYATGWLSFGPVDVSRWAGTSKSITLRFALNDVGDSLYDTVVMLDSIRLE